MDDKTKTEEESQGESPVTTITEIPMEINLVQADEGQTENTPEVQNPPVLTSSTTASLAGAITDEDRLLEGTSSDESVRAQLKEQSNRQRLRKAERKRYKWLVSNGHTHEEAYTLCKLTIAEREALHPAPAVKRVRSEDSTPDRNAQKKVKTQQPGPSRSRADPKREQSRPSTAQEKGGKGTQRLPDARVASTSRSQQKSVSRTVTRPPKSTYSGMLKGVKVGLVPADHPEGNLAVEDMTELEKRLARLILGCEDNIVPTFNNVVFRPGFMVINCDNQATADWVKSKEEELQLPHMRVQVRDEKNIPGAAVATAYFPNSLEYTVDEIRTFIDKQNPSVNTAQWKVLKVGDTGKNCREIVFSLDHGSLAALQALENMVNYRLGKVKFWTKKPPSAQSSAAAGDAVPVDSGAVIHDSALAESEPSASAQATATPTPMEVVQTSNRAEEEPKTTKALKPGKPGDGRPPPLRQERDKRPIPRNKGKPWKHSREDRKEHH